MVIGSESPYNTAFIASCESVSTGSSKVKSYLFPRASSCANKRLFLYFPVKLAIAAAVAVISVLIMMYNAKSKMTVNGNTYAKDGVRIHRREDRFINTTVTTRKIQTSSGSKGGGGGGNSGSAGGHF